MHVLANRTEMAKILWTKASFPVEVRHPPLSTQWDWYTFCPGTKPDRSRESWKPRAGLNQMSKYVRSDETHSRSLSCDDKICPQAALTAAALLRKAAARSDNWVTSCHPVWYCEL